MGSIYVRKGIYENGDFRVLNKLVPLDEERFEKGEAQKQLSKEFVREWLMENGFQGKEGQQVPEMTDEIVAGITNRYMELYEKITGEKFEKTDTSNLLERIEKNIEAYL